MRRRRSARHKSRAANQAEAGRRAGHYTSVLWSGGRNTIASAYWMRGREPGRDDAAGRQKAQLRHGRVREPRRGICAVHDDLQRESGMGMRGGIRRGAKRGGTREETTTDQKD